MNKQIEEMAKTMCAFYGTERCYECRYCRDCHTQKEANRLYSAGYRKASDVAREIFDELETVLYSVVVPTIRADGRIGGKTLDGLHIRIEDYNTIAKKYTESEG